MFGDGDCRQRKQDDDLQSTDQYIEIEDTLPPQRPMTALPGAKRPTQSDSQGAAGGEGSGYTLYLSELERQTGGQGRMLLEIFLFDQVERGPFEPNQRNLVQTAVCPDIQQDKGNLSEIASRLRVLADELNSDVILNRLIDEVPILSPKVVFMEICHKMFGDGQCNWGRVVALFCFVYQLIKKAVLSKIYSTVDSIPWIKEIFSWAMDCFYRYAVEWIIQRGGWRMIREYFGPTPRSLFVLGVAALCTVLYVWWKQE